MKLLINRYNFFESKILILRQLKVIHIFPLIFPQIFYQKNIKMNKYFRTVMKYRNGIQAQIGRFSRIGKLHQDLIHFRYFFSIYFAVNLIVFQFVNTCIDL
jgi:hypothetical protein